MRGQEHGSNLSDRIKQLTSSEEGGSLPLFGLLLIPLVCFIGLAVDTSRGYAIKSRVSNALDAAALASIHSVGTEYFEGDVQQYFDVNFPQGYLGANVTLDAPKVSADGNTIELSASAEIDTTLMRLLNVDTIEVGASTTVTTGLSTVDVVLSFDMSGSMAGSRISSARDAAEILIDTLVAGTGNDNIDGNVRFGVVPWNSNVNVSDGTTYSAAATTWQTVTPDFRIVDTPSDGTGDFVMQDRLYFANNSPVPLLTTPPSGWGGCVYARLITAGPLALWTNTTDNDDADFLRGQVNLSDSNVDWLGWEPKQDNGQCLSHTITPLTADQEAVRQEIRDLLSPAGNTNIPQGLAWAWRVLMPGVPYTQADSVVTGGHKRAIVLLSDGANTVTSQDAYRGRLNEAKMNERLLTIAQNAKDEGATIYVIQYADEDEILQNLLMQVAQEPNPPYYNFAPDAIALEAVFEGIAQDLTSELRVAR